MKLPSWAVLAVLVTLNWPHPASSQVYTPDTEFHDMSQRFFIVEAARVLTWREASRKAPTSEILYEVKTDEKRQISWHLKWVDQSGNTLREADVSYPETLLTAGPAFYRQVFAQVWKLGWRAGPKLSEKDLLRRFWQGAELIGVSRSEGLLALLKTEQAGLTEEESAPLRAGAMQNIPLPSLAGAHSLDAILLARGAVWLCLAETMSGTRSPAEDACWAPTLFLAGREKSAQDLWKRAFPGEDTLPGEASVGRGWNFLMQHPKANVAFRYAVKKGNEKFAMPLMVYYARISKLEQPLAQVIEEWASREPALVLRLYDYAPYLGFCGIEAGRILEGAYPAFARKAWLQALSAVPTQPFDYQQHVPLLPKALRDVTEALKKPDLKLDDASLIGLSEASAVLTEGFSSGMGPLSPTGVLSAVDLLNYGWESSGWQMTVRYRFVRDVWGVGDLAETIRNRSTELLVGYPSFGGGALMGTSAAQWTRGYRRLEFLDLNAQALSAPRVPVWGLETSQNAKWWYRRCWLRAPQVRQQALALANSESAHELVPFLKRAAAEGGAAAQTAMVEFRLDDLSDQRGSQISGLDPFLEDVAKDLSDAPIVRERALWDKRYDPMPHWERATTFERMFWESSGTQYFYTWAYENYLLAHANVSARRFYDQMSEVVKDPVRLSNLIGLERFIQAFFEQDEAGMKKVLRDCNSGSAMDMLLHQFYAAAHKNLKALKEQLDEEIDRYGSRKGPDSRPQRLKRFVPLIPALEDPKHPDHGRALDYFANDSEWAIMQWILLKTYGLSTEEAIRFLGGEQSDPIRQAFSAYLKKNKEGFQAALVKVKNADGFQSSRFALLTCMGNELLSVPVPSEQPDLRPRAFKTIIEEVREVMAGAKP